MVEFASRLPSRPRFDGNSDGQYFEVRYSGDEVRVAGDATVKLGYYAGSVKEYYGWRWDGAALEVYSDRYACGPLFWSRDPNGVQVATSIPLLLSHGASAEPDDDAMSVFIRRGFFLGEDTPFLRIKAMPPGGQLTWRNGDLRLEGSRVAGRLQGSPDLDDVVDEYIKLFRDAMDGAPFDVHNGIVPLSGGKDSRHIFLELHATGRSPSAVPTFEQLPWQEANLDLPIAAELTRRANVRHVVLQQPRDPLGVEMEKNLLCSYCSDEHAHVMALQRYLSGRSVTLFDGMAGDVLSESKVRDPSWSAGLGSGDVEGTAQREMGQSAYVPRILRQELSRRWSRERAVARMKAELSLYVDDPNPFGAYRFWTRGRREIALAPLAILGQGNVVSLPYLYPPLFDFLSGLPAAFLAANRIHTAAMRRAYPSFADVPFDYERHMPSAAPYRQTTSRRAAAQQRLHSMRWILSSLRFATTGSDWIASAGTNLLGARSLVQFSHASLPWLPRMLVLIRMIEEASAGGRR